MKKIMWLFFISLILNSSLFAVKIPSNHIIDVYWLKNHINDKNLVIVDVRKKGYELSHIKGAFHWSSNDFREGRYYSRLTRRAIPGYIAAPKTFKNTMQKSGINNNSVIVFYSDGTKAKDFRDAALALFTCEYYGFDNAVLLNGGFQSWQLDFNLVEKERAKPKRGNFSFKGREFNQDILATGEDVDEALATNRYQIIDGNGKDEHFLGKEKIDARRLSEGHLKGAKALHPKKLVTLKNTAYYLARKDKVLKEFKDANIDLNKPMLWYCNTGHLIAGNWFVTKYILNIKDKNNRVYNGSMADYTRWPNRELIKGDK
jgi:thiosulfate/3-mercaptopyruvate sulfurtransferase